MNVIRGYKAEIDPNNKQRTLLLKHAGAARWTYNWGLSEKKKAFDAKEKTPNAIELHRRLNLLKKTEIPWMYEVSKCCGQEALRNLDRAFDNFFRRCKQKVKGKKGFPKFKSKHKGIGSFRLTGTIKVTDKTIQLPRLGCLRLKEHGYFPTNAKILSSTVSEQAGRWYVSIQVEEYRPEPSNKPEAVVGVDLGIKTLVVCSDGIIWDNPKALRSRLRKLKHLQRCASRRLKGSKNRKKAVKKLARLHQKIGNVRKDTLNKITTQLTKTKSKIVIEDLNVSGMMKNHCLAQSIADLGLHEFRRQLDYKGKLYGCQIIVADRFFPSSRLCRECGVINENLTLADRTWTCDCGAVHDRDMNAAKNLESLAASLSERLNDCGEDSPLAVA